MKKPKKRCFGTGNKLYEEYHDKEWGVPVHDDRKLFEMLILEGAQAGLNWLTVLKKRKGYLKAFNNFNVKKVSTMNEKDVKRLMNNPEIIRNRLKIKSTISNAIAFIKIKKEFRSFDKYIWGFVNNKQIKNKYKNISKIPASTNLSEKISKDLKKRGFKFVGSTMVYAFLQAVGIVNDHAKTCFKYKK